MANDVLYFKSLIRRIVQIRFPAHNNKILENNNNLFISLIENKEVLSIWKLIS